MSASFRQRTIELTIQYMSEIGVELPLDEDDVYRIFEFFSDKEVFGAMDLEEGKDVDRQMLDDIADAVDDYNRDDLDLDELNLLISEKQM